MNRIKPTSSLLLLATILSTTAPLHADYGTEFLPNMFASSPQSTTEHAHKLPLSEQYALREKLVEKYGTEVARSLPVHGVNPQDLMKLLGHVGKDVQKSERLRGIFRQTLLGLATIGTCFGVLVVEDGDTSSNLVSIAVGLIVGSGLNLTGLLAKEGLFNGFKQLPDLGVTSKGFFELRDLRQTIADNLSGELKSVFINNRKFVDRAALALTIEKAYSKKQMQIAAIGGAVLLSAAVLYLAVSSIRRDTKAAAATLGAGALGGLAGLLSLSPFATPVMNERLMRLQSKYRQSLRGVTADRSH